MRFLSVELKSAAPYGGRSEKSVEEGGFWDRNCFLISTR